MNKMCCGVEMETIGFKSVATETGTEFVDICICHGCGQGINTYESRFENGKMRADGMEGRFDQVEQPIDVEKKQRLTVEDRKESVYMNKMHSIVHICARHGVEMTRLKTPEQRRAELSAILERHIG